MKTVGLHIRILWCWAKFFAFAFGAITIAHSIGGFLNL